MLSASEEVDDMDIEAIEKEAEHSMKNEEIEKLTQERDAATRGLEQMTANHKLDVKVSLDDQRRRKEASQRVVEVAGHDWNCHARMHPEDRWEGCNCIVADVERGAMGDVVEWALKQFTEKKAIISGRTTPPTREEIDRHDGHWLVIMDHAAGYRVRVVSGDEAFELANQQLARPKTAAWVWHPFSEATGIIDAWPGKSEAPNEERDRVELMRAALEESQAELAAVIAVRDEDPEAWKSSQLLRAAKKESADLRDAIRRYYDAMNAALAARVAYERADASDMGHRAVELRKAEANAMVAAEALDKIA